MAGERFNGIIKYYIVFILIVHHNSPPDRLLS